MSEPRKPTREEIEKLVLQGMLHARVEEYEEAAQIFATHLPELASGSDDDKITSASAFSYYGLCIAALYKKYSEAIEYCRVSMRVQRSNPEHYENLGKIYLMMRNRKRAVEAFFRGLDREPGNPSINRILDRIGRRREPVISFLSRDFPINIWLGRIRHDKDQQRRADITRIKRASRGRGSTTSAEVRLKHAQLRADQYRADRRGRRPDQGP